MAGRSPRRGAVLVEGMGQVVSPAVLARPLLDMVRSIVLFISLLLAAPLSAQDGVRADRTPVERAAVLLAVVAPAAATGALWGFADGTQNEWRWANVNDGLGSPREAELNQRWHAYGTGARVMVLVDVAAAIGVGAAIRPDWQETAALTATASTALLLSHHLAHNVQQGQGLLYFGNVAPTDRLANRIGPVPVAIATVAAAGAVVYLTYRLLD